MVKSFARPSKSARTFLILLGEILGAIGLTV